MRTFAFTLALLSVTALGACGPLFFSEVEVPELCSVRRDATFELHGPPVPLALSQDLSIDLQTVLPEAPDEATGRISLLRVTARSGIDDFGFVQEASLRLAPSDAPLETAEVLTYSDDAQLIAPVLHAEGAPFDLQPLLRTGQIVAHVALEGTPPPAPFVADVEVCLSAMVRYAY